MRSSPLLISSLILIFSLQIAFSLNSQSEFIGTWSSPTVSSGSNKNCCIPDSITMVANGTNNLDAIYRFPLFSDCSSSNTEILYPDGYYQYRLMKDQKSYTYSYVANKQRQLLTAKGIGISGSASCSFQMKSYSAKPPVSNTTIVIGLLVLVSLCCCCCKTRQKKEEYEYGQEYVYHLPDGGTIKMQGFNKL